MNNRPYNIGSAEFKQWAFCPRHWYLLRTTGKRAHGPAVQRSMEFHARKSKEVITIKKTQSLFLTAVILGGIVCIIWLLS